ncbi:hypothetical protein MRB53_030397 [Persea americana]|uniref:Uncharacterized protein n=1 Tax=Persea americana TaxID=3435 RepID=A0ACC2KLR5_PERAE|nr:hypothetical protein MRB53_030397 [Persea americana]
MAEICRCKTIGPTVPSAYLDKSIEGDTNYGITLLDQNADSMNWLNTRETGSVVYISFGSIAELVPEQMETFAWGLRGCNYYFLWVVRASEEDNYYFLCVPEYSAVRKEWFTSDLRTWQPSSNGPNTA